MSISYRQGDELPPWLPTVTLNGERPDFSTDFTFRVVARLKDTTEDLAIDKTDEITGFSAGGVEVSWADGDLDIPVGLYEIQLIAKRTSDDHEWSIVDDLIVRERLDA